MSLEELLHTDAFGVGGVAKERLLLRELTALHERHVRGCAEYAAMARVLAPDPPQRLSDLLFLPVGLFKSRTLRSVPAEQVSVELRSSGTSGARSRVLLDRATATRQTRALVRIMAKLTGPKRLPMIVVDRRGTGTGGGLDARVAAYLGMMNCGRDHLFLLDDEGRVDRVALEAFRDRHRGERILVFGLTSMVWQHVCRSGLRVDLGDGLLVHGGGWKRLEHERVAPAVFADRVRAALGIGEVRNYYGMVEQLGSIFLEDSAGRLCAPVCADVIVRDPVTWEPVPPGVEGVVQVLGVLPDSYPGHSILTADVGVVEAPDDDTDGWRGTRFRIRGRLSGAELRGCSDVRPAPGTAVNAR